MLVQAVAIVAIVAREMRGKMRLIERGKHRQRFWRREMTKEKKGERF